MGVYQTLRGLMNDLFQLGGPTGVQLKNSAGILLIRNAADAAYAQVQASAIRLTTGAAAGSVLVSNASGDGAWTALASIASEGSAVEAFTQATSSPLTIITPPANARLTRVGVSVTVAAGGGSPTISIGVTGTPAAYMATNENSLLAANEYTKELWVDTTGSPVAIIATIVASAQTFTGTVWVEWEIPQ